MSLIDTSTDWGRSAERLLRTAEVAWLTTLRADRSPWPNPVWFVWDGETFLVYSRPESLKLRHIARDPRVALNLNGGGWDLDIVVVSGTARVAPEEPPVDQASAYLEKYSSAIERLGMTVSEYTAAFSVPIRITPTGARGH